MAKAAWKETLLGCVILVAGLVALGLLWGLARRFLPDWVFTVVLWIFMAGVAVFVYGLARESFARTDKPWRTARNAVIVVLALSALGAYQAGRGVDPENCEREENGTCVDYPIPTTVQQRLAGAVRALLLFGVPVLLAAISGRRRFPDPDAAAGHDDPR